MRKSGEGRGESTGNVEYEVNFKEGWGDEAGGVPRSENVGVCEFQGVCSGIANNIL